MKSIFRQIAFSLAAVVSLSVMAEESTPEYVRITTETDDVVYVQLSQLPEVTVTSKSVVLTAGDDVMVFPFEKLPKLEFANPVGVVETENALRLRYVGHLLTIEGVADHEEVSIYAMSGALMARGYASAQTWMCDTSSWAAGVYIVKTKNLTAKLIIK